MMPSNKKRKAKNALPQPDKKKGRWRGSQASVNGRVIDAFYGDSKYRI
jgi:hypothetical protein